MSQKKKNDLGEFLDELNSTIQKNDGKAEQKEKNPPSILKEKRRALEESSKVVEQSAETSDEVAAHADKHITIESVEVIEEPEKKKEKPAPAEALPPAQRSRKKRKASRREIMTAILGIFMTFFVIIGVISTVVMIVNVTSNLANSTVEKDEFARYLFPMVIIDVPEFESADMLDNSQIIASAIWAFIIDEQNDKAKYPHDDLGGMTVPDADIEPYIRRLYGSELKIKHQTVDGSSFQMLYDEETKSYIIESTPRFLPYTPLIDEIVKEGDIYTLRVGYVQPDVVWNLDPDNRKQDVDKVMQYVLKKETTGYSVRSVKLLEVTGIEMPTSELTASIYGEIQSIEQNIIIDLPLEPIENSSAESLPDEDTASDGTSSQETTSEE